MLVDDEPDMLDLLEKALNLEGFYNITKVDTGSFPIALFCFFLQKIMN